MREYRGQRVDNKEWVYGWYREQPTPLKCVGNAEKPKSYIIFKNPNYVSDWGMPIQMVECEVYSETVGQDTGLKDKNGKMVFEGDIVKERISKETAVVEWHNDLAMFTVLFEGIGQNKGLFLYNVDCEVIGNIHDNEFLEVHNET